MKIAVVSTDHVRVNDWFSRATRFLIYEVDRYGATFIDERGSEPLPSFFDVEMVNYVVDLISDCERVYLANIKDKPARVLRNRGIMPVVYSGPILAIDTLAL